MKEANPEIVIDPLAIYNGRASKLPGAFVAPIAARSQGTPPDLPGYCARTFTLMPVGYKSQRAVHVLGFADICLLTPVCRLNPLPVRQASALLRLPPDSQSPATPLSACLLQVESRTDRTERPLLADRRP
jgi:hypothetical protein